MGVTLVADCPHCGTVKAGFTLVGSAHSPVGSRFVFSWFFQCNHCHTSIIVAAGRLSAYAQHIDGDLLTHHNVHDVEIFPAPIDAGVPAHCTDQVNRAFTQAHNALRREDWDSAVAMDRRVIELATKQMAPAHQGTLYARIEHLATSHLLPPALKDWAHSLRLLGNDALHEIDGVTEDEAMQAHSLAKYILLYLFTLPEQVAAARPPGGPAPVAPPVV